MIIGKIVNVLRRVGGKDVDAMLLGRIVDGNLVVWWRRQIKIYSRKIVRTVTYASAVAAKEVSLLVKKLIKIGGKKNIIAAPANEAKAIRVTNAESVVDVDSAPANEIEAVKVTNAESDVVIDPAPAEEIDADKAACFAIDTEIVPAPAEEIKRDGIIQIEKMVHPEGSKIFDLSDGKSISMLLKTVLDNCIPTDVAINHFEKVNIKALLENSWLNKLYFRKRTKSGHSVNISAIIVESFKNSRDIKNGLISKLYSTATKTLEKKESDSFLVDAFLESHAGGIIFGRKKVADNLETECIAAPSGIEQAIKRLDLVTSSEAYTAKGTSTASKNNIIVTSSYAGIGFTPPVWFDPKRIGNNLYIRSVNTVLQENEAIWIDPWFAYEPPVQIDNVLYVTEVIDVTINNNTAEVV